MSNTYYVILHYDVDPPKDSPVAVAESSAEAATHIDKLATEDADNFETGRKAFFEAGKMTPGSRSWTDFVNNYRVVEVPGV